MVSGNIPNIDTKRISVLGYGFGSIVGLYATALDERISSLACFSGLTPMRSNTNERITGGNRRLWQWHALLPKLGLFQGRESEIPYDYEDVLSLIAPRPCLLYTPQRDRFADYDKITQCISVAARHWPGSKPSKALRQERPYDINRFQKAQQDVFIKWLKDIGF